MAEKWADMAASRERPASGDGARAVFETLRTRVAKLENDRYMHDDMATARALLRSGALVASVERAIGPLDA